MRLLLVPLFNEHPSIKLRSPLFKNIFRSELTFYSEVNNRPGCNYDFGQKMNISIESKN